MGGPLAWPRPLPPPLPGEVRGQLGRILDSPELAVPELMRGFLRYLVEQTLARCAEQLKGYTIGTAVFERDVSFDSQADPVVRTEAGRLRRALERYYLVAGQCRKAARSHILPPLGPRPQPVEEPVSISVDLPDPLGGERRRWSWRP